MPLLFFFELLFLFYLSRKTTQNISAILYRLTRSKKITIFGIATIFLPGTVIHEFSHAIAAVLLRVPVGKMELFPEFENGNLKLGSVQVGKTDLIRNFFIGVAPFIFGTVILFCIVYVILARVFPFGLWIYVPLFYLIFTISNTMFSSKRDMEGAIEFFLLVAVLFLTLYILGFRPQEIQWGSIPFLYDVLRQGAIFLSIPIGIDVVIILLSLLLSQIKK